MPSLAELSDYYPQQDTTLPVASAIPANIPRVYINTAAPAQLPDMTQPITDARPEPLPEPISPQIPDNNGFWSNVGMAGVDDKSGVSENPIIKKLFGLGGEERYQTWPEKIVREALAAPHDTLNSSEPVTSQDLIAPAQAVSALAGTGGLAGADASLGSTAFLRPALKYENKIYKAPMGGQHLDALPAHLAEDFQTKAMNGEDINHYNFGFMNHKGQFLSREAALDYAVKEGLVDPSAGQYGALTSTLMADSSKPGTAIEAMAKSNPFYSALEHNVNAIQQGKMTGDQWLGTLSNKPGVKPEEMDWTGVKSFLEERGKQPVTKAELQEHLQNNKVELKEVDKADKVQIDPVIKFIHESLGPASKHITDAASIADARKFNAHFRETTKGMSDEEVLAAARASEKLEGIGDSKYHSYQLPGGTNYSEKLLTLPSKLETRFKELKKIQGEREFTPSEYDEYNSNLSQKSNTYKSSHWDEPNILAHVRMNDRMIDGKKSLHIEEIQSDWHQQGRDKGYKTNHTAEYERMKNKIIDKYKLPYSQALKKATSEEKASMDAITEKAIEEQENPNRSRLVPNAPFKKSWHELALKRMIREAAEKGYDRLSWTPGEAQAARYDLSKTISKVEYNPIAHHIIAYDKSGHGVINKLNVEPKDLPDIIGKEAADRIMNTDQRTKMVGGDYHKLENADLKIGGEGMKGFYDQIIPKALEKISGEKVKTGDLKKTNFEIQKNGNEFTIRGDPLNQKFKTKEAAQGIVDVMAKSEPSVPIHYIDLPQSLKDKALGKGFPLFSSSHMYTPIAGNPFESKDK